MKDLAKKLKALLKKYEILEDIIFFGSFVKGKSKPKDIDIALLVHEKGKTDIIEDDILKLLDKKIDFTVLSIKDIYSSVWLSLLKEGYSVLKNKYLHELYDVTPCILYKYSLKTLTPVQKVQFDRGLNKILKEVKGTRLIRTVVIIPLSESGKFEAFLKTWKMEYETQRYELIPELVKSPRIME